MIRIYVHPVLERYSRKAHRCPTIQFCFSNSVYTLSKAGPPAPGIVQLLKPLFTYFCPCKPAVSLFIDTNPCMSASTLVAYLLQSLSLPTPTLVAYLLQPLSLTYFNPCCLPTPTLDAYLLQSLPCIPTLTLVNLLQPLFTPLQLLYTCCSPCLPAPTPWKASNIRYRYLVYLLKILIALSHPCPRSWFLAPIPAPVSVPVLAYIL